MDLKLMENNANRGQRAFYTYASSKRNYGEFSVTREVRVEMENFEKPLGRVSSTIRALDFSL